MGPKKKSPVKKPSPEPKAVAKRKRARRAEAVEGHKPITRSATKAAETNKTAETKTNEAQFGTSLQATANTGSSTSVQVLANAVPSQSESRPRTAANKARLYELAMARHWHPDYSRVTPKSALHLRPLCLLLMRS